VNDSTASGPQSAGSNGFVRPSFLRMRHRKLKSLLAVAALLGNLRGYVSYKTWTNRSASNRTSAALVALSARDASSTSPAARHWRQHSLILGT
jgi:hypothetical protein